MYTPRYRYLARALIVRALRDWRDAGAGRRRPLWLAGIEKDQARMYYTADVELYQFFYSPWALDVFELANLDITYVMRFLGIPYNMEEVMGFS